MSKIGEEDRFFVNGQNDIFQIFFKKVVKNILMIFKVFFDDNLSQKLTFFNLFIKKKKKK